MWLALPRLRGRLFVVPGGRVVAVPLKSEAEINSTVGVAAEQLQRRQWSTPTVILSQLSQAEVCVAFSVVEHNTGLPYSTGG